MAANDDQEITFQQQDAEQSEPPCDTTSFQFVPEKIVDFSMTQDGQRSYRVRWKDSWLTEELLALTYQHLINDFWSASANVNKESQKKITKLSSSIKIAAKHKQYTEFAHITPNISIKSSADTSHIDSINHDSFLEQGSLLKSHTIIAKKQDTSNSLNSLIANNESLSNLQYQDIVPAMLSTQSIPKYQQALQQPITVQTQPLSQDSDGKVTFPKHVFSQARFLNKKQQQQIAVADGQRVQCDICQKSLKTKKMLWAHKVAVHYGGNFPCEMCGKKCITGAELRRHMTSHSTERKFICQYCGLAYKRWSHLYQHLRVHEEEKNFRCDVCHVNFKVQSELKDHCFAEHNNGDMVQCSVCRHKLQTPLAVYHHSMKHTGTRDFNCEICSATFKRKQHLVTHMKTHLSETRQEDGSNEVFNCQACDAKFTLKMDLKSHCDSVHILPGDESVNCKTCQRKLNVSHSVYLHGLRHCGVRDFPCNHCDQKFKRKAHLLRHQQDRHPAEPRERKKREVRINSTVCGLCRKTFKYKTVLIKHMVAQHGILPKADGTFKPGVVYKKFNKKPFQCDHCPHRFKTSTSLTKHNIAKHESEMSHNHRDEEVNNKNSNFDHLTNEAAGVMANMCTSESNLTDMLEVDSSGVNNSEPNIPNINENMQIQETFENKHLNAEIQNLFKDEGADENENKLQKNKEQDQISVMHKSSNILHPNTLVSRRILTLDETGQLILVQEDDSIPIVTESSSLHNNVDQRVLVVHGVSSNTNPINVDHSHVINVQGNDHSQVLSLSDELPHGRVLPYNNVTNESELSPIMQNNIRLNEDQQQVVSLGEHNIPITLGQIISQNGVITSVPLQSMQGLERHNLIQFTQENNEEIVVLLSALNSQSLHHM
ncbi:zinc finger protein 181 [Hydra vulgaris]|uniref:zinc finger protein 181 n=1 Tax=Hydra vulgaris TaxID=6087 RepID=UPI0006410252|nr:zinc finger protein 181 [Hydra vulgaris]